MLLARLGSLPLLTTNSRVRHLTFSVLEGQNTKPRKRHNGIAHFYERKANALVKRLCFDEAIECHLSAAKCLAESYQVTDNARAKESIQLQEEYHLKQKDFLRLKKIQYQALKEVIRVSKMMKGRDKIGKDPGNDKDGIYLPKTIYRTIDEIDSLLEIINYNESNLNQANATFKESDPLNLLGMIHPKDDKTVIEELKMCNSQLRELISELLAKLADSEREVESLRQKVAELETENRCLAPDLVSASDMSSPFVLSPEDEVPPKRATAELPALAPLEMPNFDMSILHKKFQTH